MFHRAYLRANRFLRNGNANVCRNVFIRLLGGLVAVVLTEEDVRRINPSVTVERRCRVFPGGSDADVSSCCALQLVNGKSI